LTFTRGHFEIRKWPKNYQNLLRTFIETFTPNFIQIRLVVLSGVNKEVKENNNSNKKPNPILAFYIQTRGAQTTI
jgi:hypothetical protein